MKSKNLEGLFFVLWLLIPSVAFMLINLINVIALFLAIIVLPLAIIKSDIKMLFEASKIVIVMLLLFLLYYLPTMIIFLIRYYFKKKYPEKLHFFYKISIFILITISIIGLVVLWVLSDGFIISVG